MPGDDRPATLLLNWIYHPPVGHAVEAFAAAADYTAANPDLQIHLLLNRRTGFELARCCDWIRAVHPIDVEEVASRGAEAACLSHLPRQWDYVVASERLLHNRPSYSPALIRCHAVMDEITSAREWKGIRGDVGAGSERAPEFVPFAGLRMRPPDEARAWARQLRHEGLLCAVLPGGGSTEPIYPAMSWWMRLFRKLRAEFPGVRFIVTGCTDASAGRSTTHGHSDVELEELFRAFPEARDCRDVGLFNQLALLEISDLLIAPHTGFAFLSGCVGTPWLAISGTRWPDPTYARVPFYAVMPACPQYPCYADMRPECRARIDAGIRVECMDQDLDARIDEIADGVRRLRDPAFDLAASARLYVDLAREKGVNLERLYTLGMLRSAGVMP